MAYDPLAQFRSRQEPEQGLEQAQAPDEHTALRTAIDALHEMPNFPLSGEYGSSKALIPVLEMAYSNAERDLEPQRAFTPTTEAEIAATVEHDPHLFEDVRQDWKEEPGQQPDFTAMPEADLEKARQAGQRLADAIRGQRQPDREPDIEPEM